MFSFCEGMRCKESYSNNTYRGNHARPSLQPPTMGTPELNAVLQVRSHKSRVERKDHLPCPAGHTFMHSTIWLALWAARPHCCRIFSQWIMPYPKGF